MANQLLVTETTNQLVVIEPDLNQQILQVKDEVVQILTIGIPGIQGEKGDSGDSNPTFFFDYGDATPRIITTAAQKLIIRGISLLIVEAFNGINAGLTIGTDANPQLLMGVDDNVPSTIGCFETSPNEEILPGTQIKVFI